MAQPGVGAEIDKGPLQQGRGRQQAVAERVDTGQVEAPDHPLRARPLRLIAQQDHAREVGAPQAA